MADKTSIRDFVVVGDHDFHIRAYLVDINGLPLNLSDVTAVHFYFKEPLPSGECHEAVGAVFGTNPSQGIVFYNVAAGLLDVPGDWQVQVRIQEGSLVHRTNVHTMQVVKALDQECGFTLP